MSGEAEADDGAIHRFWSFIAAHRRRRFDLDTLEGLRAAIAAFEQEQDA